MRLLLFLLSSALFLTGCRHTAPADGTSPPRRARAGTSTNAAPAQVRVTPLNELVGKVERVSREAFVVIYFPLGKLPPLEQRMNVYRRGQKVAELRITGPVVDANIAADITAGQVEVGDEVRDN